MPYYLLPITHYPLPITYYLLPITLVQMFCISDMLPLFPDPLFPAPYS
ncbi:MAG: alpha/beta hydrolase [Moorea sp. SIO4G2]|nr:alpha/beta hydrolase [Moorena sp. SIO4G2]